MRCPGTKEAAVAGEDDGGWEPLDPVWDPLSTIAAREPRVLEVVLAEAAVYVLFPDGCGMLDVARVGWDGSVSEPVLDPRGKSRLLSAYVDSVEAPRRFLAVGNRTVLLSRSDRLGEEIGRLVGREAIGPAPRAPARAGGGFAARDDPPGSPKTARRGRA